MATEIIEVGGQIDYSPNSPQGAYPSYRENRSLRDIEQEVSENNFYLSFEEIMHMLHQQFPTVDPLEVFEGGCGYGFSLGGIKKLAKEFGISVHTSGATIANRNVNSLIEMETDVLFLGDIRSGFERKALPQNQYHFVLDYYGALRHDQAKTESGWWREGGNVLPIYSDIVAPGGFVFAVFSELDEKMMKYALPDRAEKIIRGAREFILEQGFSIKRNTGRYALLQKDK